MKTKRKLLTILLMVAVVMVTGCGGKKYTPGTFTDTGYESEFIGFKYTTPEGFTLATQQELQDMMGVTLDIMSDDINALQKKYAEVTTIFEMMVMNSDGSVNANISLEKTRANEKKYIESFKSQLTDMTTMSVTLKEGSETVKIAGSDYTKLSAVTETSGVTMNQDFYLRKVGDRMMSMCVTWTDGNEAARDTLLNGFAAY